MPHAHRLVTGVYRHGVIVVAMRGKHLAKRLVRRDRFVNERYPADLPAHGEQAFDLAGPAGYVATAIFGHCMA